MSQPAPNGSREAAQSAGLRYVCDEDPGIHRVRRGRGFSYVLPDGQVIRDKKERQRIKQIVIPPAWRDVWICPRPDGHILATGRDDRGRKQYCYHPRWREVRDTAKFDRMLHFGEALPELRARVDGDLRRHGLPPQRVLALVVRLLDETLIRVGNEEYAEANETYGLTTLRSEHVEVSSSKVVFDFVGKGGTERQVAFRDRRLARAVHQCHELGGQELFTYLDEDDELVTVGSAEVNDYLRDLVGEDVTAKDFRTWGGTSLVARVLAELGPAGSDKEAAGNVLTAIDAAAEQLGNTRAVCRQSYVHPSIPEAYFQGRLLDHWRVARSRQWLDRSEVTLLAVLKAEAA
ncbi:MAG: DNA topoisomerase IB [Actinomycetota bacterium]|nr:DNA topoisomerase IB [Actinomycetota bacterium]